ncbi:hypothetical protein TMA_163 [Thermus phage TMA]|uniref:hypothetical protein n=1 Tax=Thermus phage TMA TaxID=699370 RepID=UPI00021AAE0C|nr:hypothetical protein TMA_163 [Thermus phage TMA]BAK53851.1 hypothetical protein TMA_163 [Thermus phage TMA]
MEIIAKEYYKLGENLLFVIRGFTNDVSLTIRTIKSGKYIFRNTFGWTTADTQTPTTFLFSDALDDNGTKYFIIEIPKESLLKNDIYKLFVDDGNTQTEKFIFVGDSFTSPPKINVYGNLYDALGRPVSSTTLTFSVLNPVGYFDNSPITSMNASTTTDENGYFSILLNKNYNYVVVVPELNYRKVVKLSELPDSVTSVELVFGEVSNLC